MKAPRVILFTIFLLGLLPLQTLRASILMLGDLRDAGNNPWTAGIVKSGSGQTFTNLNILLPAFFLPGDTLNVIATTTGAFFDSDPRLYSVAGVDYAIWNQLSGTGSLTFTFSRAVPLEIQTHHDFTAAESVALAGPGSSWTVVDDDLDIVADGLPIPGGNIAGSGTNSISIAGAGTPGAANNGFMVSSGASINSFTWSYTSSSASAAQGPAVIIVPEPSTALLGLMSLAFALTRRNRRAP